MKKILTLLTSFLIINGSFAQPADAGSTPDRPGRFGSIQGLVTDAGNEDPVEYATIGVYRQSDSTLITGTITNTGGRFVVDKIPFGEYYVDIKFIGYQHTRVYNIEVSPGQKDIKFGEIELEQAVEEIEAVEVVAERATLEYKIDKKVLNVDKNYASAGGSAVDILENTPSVQKDVDGNIQLRGSSGFQVLVNGRPTVLEGTDALEQIQASSIKSIEIITNPSAKYDPDGTSGIINVILKKEIDRGITGIMNASYNSVNEYGADLLLNYRNKRFNVFGGFEYDKRPCLRGTPTWSLNIPNLTSLIIKKRSIPDFSASRPI